MQGPELEQVIRANIEGVQTLIVSDVSGGCGQAFDVIIVSPVFEGLPTLKRHRLVNERLKDQIAQLHAFSQKTYTPAQYEALSGKTAAPAAVAAAASSSSSASPSSAPVAAAMAAPAGAGAGGSLAAPMTPPPKTTQRQASHNRTASGVSIPELTLTTDDDTLSGRAASGAPRPLTPRDQPGGTTSKAPFNEVDYHSSPSSANPVSTSITRLHHSKIGSVDFWEGLRAWLESQLITPASPALGGEATMAGSPLASPGGGAAASTGGRDQVRGEAELIRLWEDFFQSQKPHLSASDVAKVRDGVGMFGWH